MTIHIPIEAVFAAFNILILGYLAFALSKHTKKPITLWLVGRYKGGKFPSVAWDFQGIFTTREAALSACLDKTWFVGQVEINKPLPKDTIEMPSVEYPLTKEAA